jgi:hypothetical protein
MCCGHALVLRIQVCSAAVEPDVLFAGAESEEPLVDLEGLQFESAAEGTMQHRILRFVMWCVHLGVECPRLCKTVSS